MIRTTLGQLPKYLYKYCDCKSTWHMHILKDSSIYFASPASLNDPFEIISKISDTHGLLEQLSDRLYSYVQDILSDKPHYADQRRWSGLDEFSYLDKHNHFSSLNLIGESISSRYSKPKYREASYYLEQYLNISLGMFCLAGTYDNILMWSHYAFEHSGFCIGFSTEHLLALDADYIGPVKYSRELPQLSINDLDDERTLGLVAFHKAIDWEYEDEYRIVRSNLKERTAVLERGAIHSIYLGCRKSMFHDLIVRIRESILPDARLFRARRSADTFSLDFDEL